MAILRAFVLLLIVMTAGCTHFTHPDPVKIDGSPARIPNSQAGEHADVHGKGALLLTRFRSFGDFRAVVDIEYFDAHRGADYGAPGKYGVRLRHRSGGSSVTKIFVGGISQADFIQAGDGDFFDRIWLALRSPYALKSKGDMLRIYLLSRRAYGIFGEGDIAFYDLAETMMLHIHHLDSLRIPAEDLAEKGYINTFNHVTAQAFMTTIFSEKMADFIADVHERYQIPELITGTFTEDQLSDIENGAVDNYVDMINNEWGQELGKQLRTKYNINQSTYWTPGLLENYLNDIQCYHSRAFQIGFAPFRASDQIVIRFANKINSVLANESEYRKLYY